MIEQANLPGTVNEHPNWQRKLPLGLEALAHDPRIAQLAARLAEIRPPALAAMSAAPQKAARVEAIIPRATYRLQFHKGFNFDDALKVLPYLRRLAAAMCTARPSCGRARAA